MHSGVFQTDLKILKPVTRAGSCRMPRLLGSLPRTWHLDILLGKYLLLGCRTLGALESVWYHIFGTICRTEYLGSATALQYSDSLYMLCRLNIGPINQTEISLQ